MEKLQGSIDGNASLTNNQKAIELYEEMTSEHDLSFGLEITRSGFDSLKYKSRLKEVIEELKLVKDGDQVKYVAPSPWHACLLGYYLILSLANNDFEPEHRAQMALDSGRLIENIPPGLALFRGQRRCDWRVYSSIDRVGEERENVDRASSRFNVLLQKALSLAGFPFLDDLALEAAAQHYQIPTSLIDFSTDPAVAVFFANEQDADSKCVTGRLFGITYGRLKAQKSFKLVLPPPMFERLFIQRGVFAKFEGELAVDSSSLYGITDFVKDSNFKVRRISKNVNDEILKPNLFIQNLANDCMDWARDPAGSNTDLSQSEIDTQLNRYALGIAKDDYDAFLNSIENEHLGLWSAHGARLVEGLCKAQIDGITRVVPDILDDLVRDNPVFSALLGAYYFGGAGGILELAGTQHLAFREKYEFARLLSKSMKEIVPALNTKLNR